MPFAFVVVLTVWPLVAASLIGRRSAVPGGLWPSAVALVVLTQAGFWYARARCSSVALSYWDGLRIVSGSLTTGWMFSTILVSWPFLLLTFLASVAFAASSDVRHRPREAAIRYGRLVRYLYQHRLWK